MSTVEMRRRFEYRKPDDGTVLDLEAIRGHMWALADLLDETLPEGREKALAITNLEQAHYWANGALVRPSAF